MNTLLSTHEGALYVAILLSAGGLGGALVAFVHALLIPFHPPALTLDSSGSGSTEPSEQEASSP